MRAGEVSDYMYVVHTGRVVLQRDRSGFGGGRGVRVADVNVNAGDSFCEQVLMHVT